MRKTNIVAILSIGLVVFFSGDVLAGTEYERPKFKISAGSAWGTHDAGDVYVPGTIDYTDDPTEQDAMYSIEDRLRLTRYNRNRNDYSGHIQLGYNFSGPWYVNGGFYYEIWDEIGDAKGNYSVHTLFDNLYMRSVSIVPFISIEYTNRFWKINYNSSVGLAHCNSRADIKYNADVNDEIDLGTYTYNSFGMILSGGLAYEIFRYTFIQAQAGYRFFGGNKLEPPDDSDATTIDFNYDGVFYGLGMSFGFGKM